MSDNDTEKDQGSVAVEEPVGEEIKDESSEGRDAAGERSRESQGEGGEGMESDEKSAAKVDGNVGASSIVTDEVGPGDVEDVAEEEVDELGKARDENKKLREQVLRLAADFDNYRKRARRENEDSARRARIDVLRELLPVFDNMERAVAHAEQASNSGAVVTGVQMVVNQFQDTVGRLGVERVESVGKAFDPMVHEAIQQLVTADVEPGTVVAEMLPGYLLGGRLLRASMVVVAKAPPEPELERGPEREPEREAELEPGVDPEPVPGLEPEVDPEPVPELEPEVDPEPVPELVADPVPGREPELELEPALEEPADAGPDRNAKAAGSADA